LYGYGQTCNTACTYPEISIEPEKTYLFRFVGATIDSFVGIAIQDHNLTIVQVDGGSWIEPFETNYLQVHSGQRYAAIVKGKSIAELAAFGKPYYVSPGFE